MAKKKAEELIYELKELFVEREIKYLDKLLTIPTKYLTPEEKALQDEIDKEEMKFLKNLKSRLKYVEELNNKLTGKTGKEKSKGDAELWAKIVEMRSSVGKIVQSIPKIGTS